MKANLSMVTGDPVSLSTTSIFENLEPSLRGNPDGIAVVVLHQPPTRLAKLIHEEHASSETLSPQPERLHLEWTYRQLHQASVHLANAFLAAGLQPASSKIVCFLPNGIEYFLLYWTSILLKITLCNLDMGALQPARREELTNFMSMIKPDAILVQDTEGANAIDDVSATLSSSQLLVKIISNDCKHSHKSNSGWMPLEHFGLRGMVSPIKSEATLCEEARHDDLDRIHLILFTSGTSAGKPKGCPRHVLGLLQMIDPYPKFSKDAPCLIYPVFSANFRAIAAAITLLTLKSGGTIIMPSASFDPEAVLYAIKKFKVTNINLVPFHLHSLVDHAKYSADITSSVRSVSMGGDIITKDLLKKTEKAFPTAKVISPIHGMTEGGSLFQLGQGRDSEKKHYISGIASLGKVAKGVKVKIVNPDSGEITTRGAPGELHICSDATIRGYLNGVKAEEFYCDEDGQWFKTGDLGVIDEQENVYILGRLKDRIKRAGVPITPGALENCIENHTGAECSVIGIPHPTLGHEPFAVVRTFGATDENQLKQFILEEFGKDYALAGAASLKQLGLPDFPLNTTGKIVKRELEEPVATYLQTKVSRS